VLSALLVVFALAACGKSAEDRYRADFPPLDRDLAALGRDVAAGLRDAGQSGDAALARRFGGYARRLGELRDRIDELDPPNSIRSEHAQMVSGAAATDRALADVASAARAGDEAAARAAATRLVLSGQDLDEARRKLANSALFR
jgi:ParB-like chromosome segregation protein Spo0J